MIHGKMSAIIEALPVHSISGYEWECDGCHYHWAKREVIVPFQESRVIPYDCDTCGVAVTQDENVDRDGVPCDHDELLLRSQVLEAIAAA